MTGLDVLTVVLNNSHSDLKVVSFCLQTRQNEILLWSDMYIRYYYSFHTFEMASHLQSSVQSHSTKLCKLNFTNV